LSITGRTSSSWHFIKSDLESISLFDSNHLRVAAYEILSFLGIYDAKEVKDRYVVLARRLSLAPSTLGNWVKKFKAGRQTGRRRP